jgi:hypothetical protein
MFEKFTAIDARDFRQRYQGSYGFFVNRASGERRLVQLANINTESRRPTVKFIDKNGIDFSLSSDHADELGFEFIPPRSCWKNTSKYGALLSRRVATRQYIRGLHENNTVFEVPAIQNIVVGFDSIDSLYTQKVPSFAELLVQYKGDLSNGYAALSDYFALGIVNRVMCLDKVIGNYAMNNGEFIVELTSPLMQTELVDAFKRNNLKVVIK